MNETNSDNKELLKVEELRTSFFLHSGELRAVDGVSFQIKMGEVMGIVGESGCGKSATALSILRLIPSPPGRIVGGRILFKGTNLLDLSDKEIRQVRGNQIAMIFQEPMTALNPVFTIGNQIGEVYRIHRRMNRRQALEASIQMLEMVRIPEARKRVNEYPHQLSGGMRQRVMIAMALACEPDLLLADEPTTALDVTVQAQILALMDQLRKARNCAVLLITHDLGIVAEFCHRVAVMYAGEIVEEANVHDIFETPLHPYTRGLIKCIPRADKPRDDRLYVIQGTVPSGAQMIQGCRFAARCPERMEICTQQSPMLLPKPGVTSTVRCFLHHEGVKGSDKAKQQID